MTAKKGYNRFFIIFQEEDKGFGIAIDKQPTGYTKIESRNGKCKITVYVQNLVKEKGPYLCCLLDTTKNPVVMAKMGEINVDETGRGETWWEYREEDIAESGMPADRFNTAAVVIEGKEILAPLAGYIGKDRQAWKDRLPLNNNRSEKVEEKTEPEEEVLGEEGKKFREYEDKLKGQDIYAEEKSEKNEERNLEEKVAENVEIRAKDNVETRAEPEVKAEVKEMAAIETKPVDTIINKEDSKAESAKTPEKSEIDEEIPENEIPEIEINNDLARNADMDFTEEDEDRHKKKKSHAAMFIEILSNYEEIKDISPELKGCRWWKVPNSDNMQVKDNDYYPYYCAVHHLKMTYPYLNYIKYFKKCGYFYFGIKFDKDGEIKYFMYGIEGDKNRQDQPFMGMTGFAKWVHIDGKDTGMWIMYYNPYTGCIMIPKKELKMKEDYD